MPGGAAARGPLASPGRGPMALGWALLVMLVLSILWDCGSVPLPELRQHQSEQWVWGASGPAQDEPLPPSRRKRDSDGSNATTATLGHGHDATSIKENDSLVPDLLLGSVPPPAPSTNANLDPALVVTTTAHLLDETDSPQPDSLLDSVPPPAPSTFTSLHWALPVPTTADPLDETDHPDPDLLLSSMSSVNTSLLQAFPVPTTTDSLDETHHPDPDLLLSSVPSINTSPLQAFPVPTTANPLDETDSPNPHLLQDSGLPAAPSTEAAPEKSITTIPSWLTLPSEKGMVAGGTDNTSSVLKPTTTAYKKARDPPATTHSTSWDVNPWGTPVPVPRDSSRWMGKCLLAILVLALVAATFMGCTGVLASLLWQRRQRARRRFSPTEMVCISSLLPDGETVPNGPKPVPARRQKLLPDGGSEVDGDNLTLSSFLPEHS